MVRHWLKERSKNATAKIAHTTSNPHFSSTAKSALPDAVLAADGERRSAFVTDEVTSAVHWKKSILVNGIGAIATFVVLVVFIITKFIHGPGSSSSLSPCSF